MERAVERGFPPPFPVFTIVFLNIARFTRPINVSVSAQTGSAAQISCYSLSKRFPAAQKTSSSINTAHRSMAKYTAGGI